LVGRVERKNTSLKKELFNDNYKLETPTTKDIIIIDEISNPKSNLGKTLV